MRNFTRPLDHLHSSHLKVLLCFILIGIFAACGGPSVNPDSCTVVPPSGYPKLVAANGMIYLHSDYGSSMYAIRASDGSLSWKYHAGTLLQIADDIVYIQGLNDTFYALRARDGTQIWHYDMSKDVSSVIAVVNGLVYFTSSNSLTMYTLRGSDGTRLWQHKIDVDHYPSVIQSANGIAYIAADYSRVIALRESDGSQVWQYNTGTEPPANPLTMILNHGIVYVTSDQTTALSASDGKVLWHFPKVGQMAVSNGKVYIGDDQLYALQSSDGKQIWQRQLPIVKGQYALAIDNGIIYTGPAEGRVYISGREHIETYRDHLYAVKASNGASLWDHALSQSPASLGLAGGTIYILTRNGVDALQASNSALIWHHPLQQVGLLVADGVAYIGTAGNANTCFPTTSSKLAALRVSDGTQLWQFEQRNVIAPSL